MKINAKFNGTCRACSGFISAGDQIEWSRDDGPRHVRCAAKAAKSAPRVKATTVATAGGVKWDEVALIGTRADCVDLRTRERGGGRGYKPQVDGEIGRVFRAGRHAGKVAGQVVTVVGASAHYTSSDWEEDCGQPGIGSGWWVSKFVRLATLEESIPLIEAERAAANKVAAAKAEQERIRSEWESSLVQSTAGLIGTCWLASVVERGVCISSLDIESTRHSLQEGRVLDEPVVIVDSSYSHGDDYRTMVYARPDFVAEQLSIAARERKIGERRAREWLANSAGCYGEDLYRHVAGVPQGDDAEAVRAASEAWLRANEQVARCG